MFSRRVCNCSRSTGNLIIQCMCGPVTLVIAISWWKTSQLVTAAYGADVYFQTFWNYENLSSIPVLYLANSGWCWVTHSKHTECVIVAINHVITCVFHLRSFLKALLGRDTMAVMWLLMIYLSQMMQFASSLQYQLNHQPQSHLQEVSCIWK